MFRIDIDVTIRRYQVLLALIILLLTGSIVISSNERALSSLTERYPYSIALTFDDGPHPYFTDHLLGLLRNEQVRATFFVVGRLAAEYPNLIEEISLGGHELAGHSFTHRNLSQLSDTEIVRELRVTRGIIDDITGKKNVFFRPPGGQYSQRVLNLARKNGFSMVLWTVFPKDHEESDPRVITKRVLDQASDGGVVLLHSGVPATYEALPGIIHELRYRGYHFVTIEEMKKQGLKSQTVWMR